MAVVKTDSSRKPSELSDTINFATSSLSGDGLLSQFGHIMRTDEFTLYGKQVDEIRIDFETRTHALQNNLQPAADSLLDHCIDTLRSLSRNKLRIRAILALQGMVFIIVGCLTYLFYGNRHISPPFLVALGVTLASITFVIAASVSFGISAASGPLMRRLQQEEDSYRQTWETQVAEVVRTSVTEVFRSIGIATFPIKSPTLVELTTAKIVPSGTQQSVVEFIRNHQSSAIGIAGPRGSGKSTLMQAIRDSGFASHTVLIPAPDRY